VLRLKAALSIFTVFFSMSAWASKFDVLGGYYSLQAKTSSSTGSLANLGSYYVGFSTDLKPHLEVGVGYSLVLSNTFNGDSGFGFDLFANYFPWSRATHLSTQTSSYTWEMNEYIRPYVGLLFSQRQFQVVGSSSYAGFGVQGGFEYQLAQTYSLKTQLRMLYLSGPSKSTANFMDLLVGISYGF
jgi:hypothetical protein